MARGTNKFGFLGWAFGLIARQRGRVRRWARRRRVRQGRAKGERVRPIPLRALESLEGRAFFSAAAGATFDVSVIDKALPQSKLLIRGAAEYSRVITFDSRCDSTADVLQRVIDLGEQTPGARVRALSVFSHGTRGKFALGDEWVTSDTVDDTAGRWRKLRGVLAVDAAIQLFSCDTAAGDDGRTLLGKLSGLTGATVFGSTDITGAGGDWDLEAAARDGVAVGGQAAARGLFSEARVPIDTAVQQQYAGSLSWIGATSGNTVDAAHEYNNPANWSGGTIDDSFAGVTLTANTTLYLTANHTTGAAGLNLGYSGNFNLSIESDSTTARTLTLGAGGIFGDFGDASGRTVTIGSATNAVNVSMNAAARTIDVGGSGDTLLLRNVLSSGTLTKTGPGTLTLLGANTFAGGTTVSAGTLSVGNHTSPGSNPFTNTALGTGTVTVSNATLTLDTQNSGGTIYVVTIANGITLNGGATLRCLEGENHLTGTLTINGTGNTIAPRTSNKPIAIDGVLTGSGSADVTAINNTFSPGTVQINGSNNAGFTGTLTVNGSTDNGVQLVVGNNAALVNATVVVNGPVPTGLANGTIWTQATSPLIFASGVTAPQIGMLGGSGDIVLLTNTASAAVALTVGGNNTSNTYSGVLSGTGSSLTKTGTGTLGLGGANTLTGGVTLSAGQLNLNHATAVGAGRLTIGAGTTIDNTSAGAVTLAGNNLQTWNGNFAYGGTNDLNLGTGALTLGSSHTVTTNGTATLTVGSVIAGAVAITKAGAGTLSLTGVNTHSAGTTINAGTLAFGAAAAGSGTITFGGSGTLKWNGGNTVDVSNQLAAIGSGVVAMFDTNGNDVAFATAISGAGGIGKAGSGALTLSVANTFTGGTTLTAGTLDINHAAAIGTGTLTINGGTLDNTSGGAITLSTNNAQAWNGNFAFTGTQALNLGTGAITLAANRQITTTAGTLTVGGAIGGAYALTKAGGGTLRLGGASTYTGGTAVTAGTLEVFNAAGGTAVITPTVLGSTSSTASISSGATLWLNYLLGGTSNTVTYANAFSGAGTLKVTAPGTGTPSTAALSGNLSGMTGTIDLFPNSGSVGKTEITNTTNGAQPSSTATIKVQSGTTLFINTGLTYASGIQIFGTGNSENYGAVRLEGNTVISGSVTLMANGSIGSQSTSGSVTGSIGDGGNGYSLTKRGAGILGLSGANTYSGGTTVAAGTLRANNTTGSGTGAGAVTVANGSTLGGTGSVSGAVTVQSGGTFAPGAGAPSAFATGAITVASGGTYSAKINSGVANTGYDKLSATGAVTLTGSTLNLTGTRTVTGGDVIVLIDNDGTDAVVGTFTGLAQGAAVSVNGVAYTISYVGGSGNDVILTDAAPTLATAAAASPSTVTGTTTNLSVLGASSAGESTLTYTWAATTKPSGSTPTFSANGTNAAKASTVTFDKSGSYTFTVTISDGTSTITSSVNVTVSQTLTAITVSPATASLNQNGTQQFSAVGYDQFGLAMASQPSFTWAKQSGVGSVNASGLYTAPGSGAGSAVVRATSGAVNGTATVTVTNAAPTIATAAAASPGTVTGTTTNLSALGADDGGESNLTYTWAATTKPAGSTPSFSANGTNAAKSSTVTFDKSGSYTFQVTISDGASTVTSSVNVTVNQTLTVITVIPASSSLNLNGTQTFTAVAYDQFGVAMASQPGFTWSKQSGVGSINSGTGVYTAPAAAGSATIAATSGAVSGTATVTVSNAAPTVATAAAASPSTVTGTTTGLSALGADDNGESNLTYTWAATTKPAGSTPSFSVNGTNAAKSSTVTFDKAGSYTFQVTISDGVSTVTSSVNVTVNQTLTAITVSPASSSLNLNGTQTFTAVAYDQFGVAMSSQPSFTWSKTAGVGSINSASGVYTAPASAGTATVQATSGAVNGTATVTVTNAAPTVATPAAATPATVTGTTTALSVLGADDNGQANLTYTWAATTKPAGSTPSFSANGTNAAKASTVTFDKAGSYAFTVTISDGSLTTTSVVNVTVNQTLTAITVSPGSSSLNLNGTQTFTAVAYDQFGVAMASQPGFTWSKASGVGSINTSTGVYTAPAAAGSATIQATSGAVSGTATVTVTNAAPTVATAAAATPSTVTSNSTALSALGADDNGESNLTYTWTATTKPAGSTPSFSINGTNAAKSSTVTFDKSGSYTFQVTISDGASTVTSSVNVTVSQTLTSISVSPASSSLNLNGTQTFTAVGYDQFGVAMASQPGFTWSKQSGVGSINSGTGVYTAPAAAGSATIQATSGAVNGTATVTVTNAAPTVATPAAATPSTVTGTTTGLSALGADDGSESNLTYTWTATTKPAGSTPSFSVNGTNAAKSSTVTFDKSGSYTFTVTISDGTSTITSSVNVTVNQTLTAITVSPASSSLNLNGTQQFSAVAYDQFGVAMASQPSFTWSKQSGVGSVSGTGLYTAPASAGTATVQATSGGVNGAATVTVTNAAPTVATAAAASPSTVTGTTTGLSALGADDNGESNLTYTWTATTKPSGSTPTFSANGTNAAKASTVTFDKSGSYTFTVTISDGTSTITSSVNVTVSQTLTAITVSPATASLNQNGTQQFSAVGYDQFGLAMASQPSFTWAKQSGVGSVNASGLYTAPGSGAGSAVVRATSGAVNGTATVTVTNAAPTIATAAAASPGTVTGTTTNLSALGADDGGESNLTYTWAATTKPAGSTPSFSANGTNAAKSSTVTFDKSGSYTFQVTISDGASTVTSSVNVTVNQTLTVITVIPASSSLNLNGTQTFTAVGYDQFGVAMASQPGFTWSKQSGVGSINSGTGVFTAGAAAGSATIQATSGAVSGTATVTITNAAPTVATAAAASPGTVTGTTTNLSALGADDGGESNLTYTWAATTKPAGSTPNFSINGTNAAKSITATFDKAGSYTFQVTISDGVSSVTSVVNVTVSQTLTSIVVTPSTASLNLNQTQALTAVAYDQFGIAMSSQPGFTWSKASGVGSVNAGGTYNAGATAGSATITATSGAVTGNATITVSNAAPTVATPAAASPATVTGTTTTLGALGADDGGESNLTYTWATTTKPAGSTPAFSVNGTNAAKSSTVTFDKSGSYTFQVTISDGTSTITSTVNVTVNQTLTSVVVSPASAGLNLSGTQAFSAVGYDQFGIAMASQPGFTWSKTSGPGSINAGGVYSAPTSGGSGSATISATSGGISGSATIGITNAAPTVATPASATPGTVTGLTTALGVLGADDAGESTLTYTWTATTKPGGASPTFSANGTNAAKNSTVTFDTAGSYTFLVTIGDGTSSVTSTVNVSVTQTLSSISVSPSSSSLAFNDTQTFTAVGYDQFGTAMSSQPTFTWSKQSGVGSINSGSGLYTAPAAAGSATVKATSGGVNGTATVVIGNAAPTVVTPAAATPSSVTGTTTALSALGADDNGEANLTYTWAATTKPSGSAPTFSANGTNAAKASTVTFDKAGSYTFTVTIDDGISTVTSVMNVTVSQTLTAIAVSPSSASLNERGTQAFGAIAYDQFGIAMSTQPGFTWSKSGGVGSINSGTGLYTAPGTAGTATIQAASGAVTGSATITVSNAAPTVVTPAAATPSAVTGTTTGLSTLGNDDNDESNLTYTWAATSKPAGASPVFSANGTNAAKASTVTFDKAGSYTFTVTIDDGQGGTATSAVNVTVSQTLTTAVVSPAGSSLNLNGTQAFTASGYDQFGIVMATQPAFTWSKTSGVGSIHSGTGVYTAGSVAGSATIQAASGGVTAAGSVTVTNAAPTVATPAAATPSTVSGVTTALSALGADDNGEANLTYTWAATAQPAGSTPSFSVNGTNAAKNITATFDKAGNYTFTVTIDDGVSTVTSVVNVTVSQTLTGVVVSPSSASVNLNGTQAFTAAGFDQFGAAMAVAPTFTWTKTSGVGSVSAGGLFTAASTPGSATIQASSGGVSGSATVTVSNAAPIVATPAAASPSTVTGTTTGLSVVGADDDGESNLTYTWAVTTKPAGSTPSFSVNGTNAAKNSTVTFDQVGNYAFTVTISDGTSSVTSSVNVTVTQTLTSIVVSPASTTATLNQSRQFTAAGFDQFGAAMAVAPTFTWTKLSGVGAIDGAGLYTSAAAGSATVRAASGAVNGTATVSVNDAAPTVATPAAASPPTVTGNTTALSALGTDDGGESNLTYTWAVSAKPAGAADPAFSINGTHAAQAAVATFTAAGNYTFVVTISDGTSSVTSSVNATVSQTLTSIVVSPAGPALGIGDTQQFTAVGYDQFGAALTSQPAVAWAVTSGGGAIDSGGLFTAAASAGTSTVTATSGGVSGSSGVTVASGAAVGVTPNPVTGTTANVAVTGPASGTLTYTWSVVSKPAGAGTPLFSVSGTNAATNSVVTFDKAGAYTLEAVISDGSSSTTVSVSFVVNQTLTSVAVTPSSASLNLNQTQQLAAVGYDQFGDALASQPAFAWSVLSGAGSVNASGLFTAAGTTGLSVVRALSGGVSGTANVTVGNAAPTVATPASATPGTVSGTTAVLGVVGDDDGGESNLTYIWAATAVPAGAVIGFSGNGANADKTTTVTFDRAGSYTFTVTVTDAFGLTVTSSVAVTVQQTLTTISVTPATAGLNLNQTQAFAAVGYDQFGAAMASQPAFVWDVASGGGGVSGGGLYTAGAMPGSATVRATSGAVSGTATVAVSDAAPTIATPASATPAPVAGTTATLTALGADDGGEAGLTYTWAATTKPAGATPAFSLSGTNAAKTTLVTFDRAGAYAFTVTVSDGTGSVTSTVNVTVDQTLSAISVTPSSAGVNLAQTQQFAAAAYDQFGVLMASQPAFAWAVTSGVGTIDASGLYVSTANAGPATVRASAGGVSGTATVTVTDAAPTIATPAGASPASVVGTGTALGVLGADDGGESNLTYTWTATAKPAGSTVSFGVNGTNAAKNTAVTFDRAGAYTFSVVIYDGTSSVTSTVNVTVNQTLTTIVVTPASTALDLNGTQQLTAIGYDQFGLAMATQPTLTWTKTAGVGSVDANGLFDAGATVGGAAVTASSGGVSGSASFTVANAAPAVATPASATPSAVTGTSTSLSVLGSDDGGEALLTYTWAVAAAPAGATPVFLANGGNGAKDTVALFDRAGNYTFVVTISDGTLTTTSTVNVAVQQSLTGIVVSPASAAMHLNAGQQFAAVGYDQFGVAMASQPAFTWSTASGVGSIDAAGLYTSGVVAGGATVEAASGGVVGGATISVADAAPTVVTPAAAVPATVTGNTTGLSVLGEDDGAEANLTYLWSVTAKPAGSTPLLAINNSNAAKTNSVTFDRAGAYTFLVTISDGTSTVTSSVSVVVQQTVASVVVSPASASLNLTGSRSYTASAFDQFGQAMASPPAFVWSVDTGGVGTINSAGLYTAGLVPGVATIRASAAGVDGTASVTVANAAPTVAVAAGATGPVTGTATTLTVLGNDDGGEGSLTYTWSVTGRPLFSNPLLAQNANNAAKSVLVTFDAAGSYTFLVTISDGTFTATSSVSVTVTQTLTSIAVTPSSATLPLHGTRSLAAAGYDQFGAEMATQPAFVWAVASGAGTVDAAGAYVAGATAGPATVTASAGGVSGAAVIAVGDTVPTVATPATASPATPAGLTAALGVLGSDDGGETNLTYTWAVTTKPAGARPVFDANGTNAAKAVQVSLNRVGTYVFTVTISDGTNTAVSTVTLVVAPVVTSVVVTPDPAEVVGGGTKSFTATAVDQFGHVLAAQPDFAWSLDGGSVGTISAGGTYVVDGDVSGFALVRATAAGQAGTVLVIVTAAPVEPPRAITGSSTAAGALHLAWEVDGASPVGFRIEQSVDGEHWTEVITLGGEARSYDAVGLPAGSGLYRIVALASGGRSAGSETVSVAIQPATPAGPVVPPAPTPVLPPADGIDIPDAPVTPDVPAAGDGDAGPASPAAPVTPGWTSDGGGNAAAGGGGSAVPAVPQPGPSNPPVVPLTPDPTAPPEPTAAPPVTAEPDPTPTGVNLAEQIARPAIGSIEEARAVVAAYRAAAVDPNVREAAEKVEALTEARRAAVQTVAGVAAVTAATALTGYVLWLVQSASLTVSMLCTMPYWRWFDPLPVLDSFDERRTKKSKDDPEADENSDSDEHELDDILEAS